MFWFRKNNAKEYIPVEDKVKDDITNVSDDEWVWIDGYKGTDCDMKCKGFQYEIGKQHDIIGDVKECENGFHLCLNLKDVFGWYEIKRGNRFFKVKALVRKSDIDNYGSTSYNRFCFDPIVINKIVAKSIIFTEEISYSNGLKEYIHDQCKFIDNEQEYISLKNTKYECLRKRKFVDTLKEIGYSELFANILYDKKANSSNVDKTLFNVMNAAKALKEEGITKNLSVYLLLKWEEPDTKGVV